MKSTAHTNATWHSCELKPHNDTLYLANHGNLNWFTKRAMYHSACTVAITSKWNSHTMVAPVARSLSLCKIYINPIHKYIRTHTHHTYIYALACLMWWAGLFVQQRIKFPKAFFLLDKTSIFDSRFACLIDVVHDFFFVLLFRVELIYHIFSIRLKYSQREFRTKLKAPTKYQTKMHIYS